MGNVMKIPARPQVGSRTAKKKIKKLRVAAYCRVSTDTEEQATSYDAQIQHYREYIISKPEWELVDIYADEGISATNTKKREEFNRMIEDCKLGRIDIVITKSISRFARNTVDCLNYIRELKEMNIPVFFEKESINTMDAKGEVLLTIMASLAQQESESLSKNVKLGMQYRFQQGKVMVNTRCFLGYDKDENGHLIINLEQAEVVKRIFREYLEGKSCKKIAQGLERDGILTSRGKTKWYDTSIRLILENEKYMGDALLQKTYTIDYLQKKRVKNTGIVPQYYIEGDHEPIIPKELFLMVQEEIARRATLQDWFGRKTGFSANHAFSQIVFCANCGEQFRRIHWNNRGKKSIVWRCITRLKEKDKCRAKTVNEETLKAAFLNALNEMIGDSDVYLNRLKENLKLALNASNPMTAEALSARMAELQRELINRTERRENYDDITEEILRLRQLREQTVMDDVSKAEYQSRIKELQAFIQSQPKRLTFDDTLVKHLLAKITIFPEHLLFEFKSGVNITIEK